MSLQNAIAFIILLFSVAYGLYFSNKTSDEQYSNIMDSLDRLLERTHCKEDKPATIVPEDMCEEKEEEHSLEDCVLYLYMREKQREEEEKKHEDYWKIVTTDTSMPPMTVHLDAGHTGKRLDAKSYTNGDAIMDIFRNSGMDVRPNSCPNCTHEIESKDAIFCSHCGKRLRKE